MNTTQPNIEILLEQCKSGNQRAQMAVYNNYYKTMYNASIRIVKDSNKAEDIMQESFLTAFTKIDTLKENALFGPWLKRIVINNSISEYQKSKKNIAVSLEDVLYKIEDEGITENCEWTVVRAAQIVETMKHLKDNYRIILTLFLIEGFDYDEIAAIMNLSYANCRTMISRAKISLKQKLQLAQL